MKKCALDTNRISVALLALLLIIFTFIIYGQSITFDFVWDDNGPHLVQNPNLERLSFQNLIHFWIKPYQGMFIPISYTAIFFITLVGRILIGIAFNPSFFHFFNILFHGINCILIFYFLRKILKNNAAAFIGSFIFLAHPIQAEAVSMVTEFRGLFSTFWGLLFLLAADKSLSHIKKNFFDTLLCIVLFLFSVLSKPVGVVFFPIFFIYALMFKGLRLEQIVKRSIPYIIISLAVVYLTKTFQPAFVLKYEVPLFSRFFIWMDSIVFYLRKIFFPLNLSPSYARTPQIVLSSWASYFIWIIPISLLVLLGIYHRKIKNVSFAYFVFIIGFLPVSGLVPFIFQNWSTVADRYIYISMIGVALFAGVVYRYFTFTPVRILIAALVVILAADTAFIQVPVWKNNITLWSHCIEKTHTEANAYYNRGNEFMRLKMYDAANTDFENAVNLDTSFTKALYKKGYLLLGQKNFNEALDYFNTVLEIDSEFNIAYVSKAVVYYYLKKYDKAWEEIRKAQIRGIEVNSHFMETLAKASQGK